MDLFVMERIIEESKKLIQKSYKKKQPNLDVWFISPHYLLPINHSLNKSRYLQIRIAGKDEKRYVEIALCSICNDEEMIFNLVEWKRLMSLEPVIINYFQSSKRTERLFFIGFKKTIELEKYKQNKVLELTGEDFGVILDETTCMTLLELKTCILEDINELTTAIVNNNEKIGKDNTFLKNSELREEEEEFRNMSKSYLLKHLNNIISIIWDELPEHLKADPEVQEHRRCMEHYNQPWQRDHIDGPPPMIKDCTECKKNKK